MSKEAIEAVVSAYFSHMGTMNPEGWVDYFADDAISPTLKSTLAGDSMAQFLRCHCLTDVAVV